jgi:citrate synthase
MAKGGSLEQLSARQAAARLGVKVQTVYAYVSRGTLERRTAEDGRTSVFDASAVEKLARRRRGSAPRTGGLSVVLGTGLTQIEEGRVSYRGRDAAKLATRVPFEAAAEWLWHGRGEPGADRDWQPWRAADDAAEAARNAQSAMPKGTASADLLRVIAAVVAPTDPLRFDLSPEAVSACGRRLIAALVDGLPLRRRARVGPLVLAGGRSLPDAIACRLWPRLTKRAPSSGALVALNAALVLGADHGLAASTFAARVAASVRADPCSVVSTGLGTLSGPLHGGASASVHRLMAEVGEPGREVAVLGEFLRREQLIPGYGHLIYEDWDPRAVVLLDVLRRAELPRQRMDVVERVLEILEERAPVRPNVDFSLGALTWAAGMDERAGETLFGIARSAGWIAHALEEYQEPPIRFRPRAHYIGPAPIEEP